MSSTDSPMRSNTQEAVQGPNGNNDNSTPASAIRRPSQQHETTSSATSNGHRSLLSLKLPFSSKKKQQKSKQKLTENQRLMIETVKTLVNVAVDTGIMEENQDFLFAHDNDTATAATTTPRLVVDTDDESTPTLASRLHNNNNNTDRVPSWDMPEDEQRRRLTTRSFSPVPLVSVGAVASREHRAGVTHLGNAIEAAAIHTADGFEKSAETIAKSLERFSFRYLFKAIYYGVFIYGVYLLPSGCFDNGNDNPLVQMDDLVSRAILKISFMATTVIQHLFALLIFGIFFFSDEAKFIRDFLGMSDRKTS